MKSLQEYIERKYKPKDELRKKIAEKTSKLEKRSRQLESGVNTIKQLKDSDASISAEIEQLRAAIEDLDRNGSERASEDLHRANNQGQNTRKKLQCILKELDNESTRLDSYLRDLQKTHQNAQMQYSVKQKEKETATRITSDFSQNTHELTQRVQDAERQLTALSRNLQKPVRGTTLFESPLLQSPVKSIRAQLKALDSGVYTSKDSTRPSAFYQPQQSSTVGQGSSEKRSMNLHPSESYR